MEEFFLAHQFGCGLALGAMIGLGGTAILICLDLVHIEKHIKHDTRTRGTISYGSRGNLHQFKPDGSDLGGGARSESSSTEETVAGDNHANENGGR